MGIQEFILLRYKPRNNRCRNRIACCSSYCTSKQTLWSSFIFYI